MQSDQLIEITRAMKLEILDIILNADLSNDREAQRTILTIDQLFERLDLAVEEVIPEDALRSYFEGVDEATKELSAAGVAPVNGLQASISSSGQVAAAFATQVHYNAIAEVTEDTMLDLKAAIRTARQNTYFTLMTTLADVQDELQRGILRGDSRGKIINRVAKAFEDDGLTSFITSDGKKLPLDFYSEVVTRTNLKRANVQGAIQRYLENGVELVEIFERRDSCAECAKYNGIIVSLTGEHEGFPTTDEAPLPPRHPNCHGSTRPFVIEYKSDKEIQDAKRKWQDFDPDKDVRSERDKNAYEEQQRLHRINNADKKQYARWKALLGDDAPKTLGAFKRMKRQNTENFQKLQSEYRSLAQMASRNA